MAQPKIDYSERTSVLSNGSTVKLSTAIALWGHLHSLAHDDVRSDILDKLRNCALQGKAFEGTAEERLGKQKLGFLDASGHLTEDAKNILLSSLIGEADHLQLVSPFTQRADRTVAEFIVAAEEVLVPGDPARTRAILNEALGEHLVQALYSGASSRAGGRSGR